MKHVKKGSFLLSDFHSNCEYSVVYIEKIVIICSVTVVKMKCIVWFIKNINTFCGYIFLPGGTFRLPQTC